MLQHRMHAAMKIITVFGFLVATLAGLAHHWAWLDSLCSGIGGSCRETAHYSLLQVPLWAWGVAFYILLIVSIYRLPSLVFWLVTGAFGTELGLMWIMFSLGTICVFCLANFFIVALMTVLVFDRQRGWQMLSMTLLTAMMCSLWVPYENSVQTLPKAEHTQDIVAKIGDKAITRQELESPIASHLYNLQLEIYNLKRKSLDQIIADLVLREEAERRGIPLQQLLAEVSASQSIDVSDAEVEKYYRENRSRLANWKGSEQQLKDEIRSSLERQKSYQHTMAYAKSLGEKEGLTTYLVEPPLPNAKVSVGDAPTQGPSDAPLTIVEFSDYRCPSCRKQFSVDEQIKKLYRDNIRWVFKAFPLGGNELSRRAAEAARCAGEQGKYWQYHDLLFLSDKELDKDQLTALAGQLGLQQDEFNACLDSSKYRAEIEADSQEARKAGVDRTPTLIVNGKMHPGGLTLQDFQELIDKELQSAVEKGR